LNEAFAAQALACMKALDLDPDKVNVNGGAIALGHPLGCTGAKLTATIINEMHRRKARYGMVTMCVGGGMGAAGIFETDVSELMASEAGHMASVAKTVRGGAWLIEGTDPATVMTPEKLKTKSTGSFGRPPRISSRARCCRPSSGWRKRVVAQSRAAPGSCGGLGCSAPNIPEEYGGVDLDKIATLIVSEEMAGQGSFATTFGAQANLTILPIYMFGTEEQRQEYLPGLVSGEMDGAYCLSESGSGSDALGAKTRAMKQATAATCSRARRLWISNGGFADVFIVFAKVDGEHFTAFIVERKWPGVVERQGRAQARSPRNRRQRRSSCRM
jgi:tryptophan synthase beta subunit